MIDRRRKRTILALLVLGQCLDALTFVAFWTVAPPVLGPTERNGIIVLVMAAFGLAGVAALKVGLGGLTFVIGNATIRGPRLPLPAWVVMLGAVTLTYRLAFRNLMLVTAATSGFVGAAFNTIAITRVL